MPLTSRVGPAADSWNPPAPGLKRFFVGGLVLLLVFLAAIAATLYLKRVGERGVEAERDLASVASQLHAEDGLEWRAISGRISPPDASTALSLARQQCIELIGRAGSEGLPAGAQRHLLALHQKYVDEVDTELQLLSAGQWQDAARLDSATVDTAFTAAVQGVENYANDVATTSARARNLSNVGLLVTVPLALVVSVRLRSRRRLAAAVEQQRRRSLQRYRTLAAHSTSATLVVNRDGTVTFLSPGAERLLHFRPAEKSEKSEKAKQQELSTCLRDRIHPGDWERLTLALVAVRPESIDDVVELRVLGGPDRSADRLAASNWRIFEFGLQDLCDDSSIGGVLITGHDVTKQLALQAEVERRALHDDLTGLPNRALLADRIDQALRNAHRHGLIIGLLLIDLDRFKEINDTLGHQYGDQLLVQVGPALAAVLRDVDTVGRLGGDEFAVLLPRVVDLAAAVAVGWKLQEALGHPFSVQGIELDVEASIGVVVSEGPSDTANRMLQRADIAMYLAKGRNLQVATYDPESDRHTPERLALLGDLRRALSNDELFLHYQPKVSLADGGVHEAEALLRWQHPQRGLIAPDDFIPLAENTGLIGPLTRQVLDRALAQTRRWIEAGTPLQIAVNMSARNLLDEDFDRTVFDLLEDHDVDPSLLKLEITESAIMTDPVRATSLLERLAAHGIDISIDDFGAGYTSIRQLRDLPITELKIDRSFVLAMETDPGSAMIVRSVVDLGHNLGLRTVAEGVESAAILDRLSSFGCDVAQGYYLSRPLPVPEFDRWWANWPGLLAIPT